MPLHKVIHINSFTTIFLWKITETFEELFEEVELKDINHDRLNSMKSELHQRAFLSVRKLLQYCNYTDFDLIYDQTGKPYLKDGKHISISHSHELATIVLSDKNIGIDLEIVKEKALRIAPRFMNVSHLENLTEDDKMKKATIVWGIKEAIFKLKNEVGISFTDHIFENPFLLSDKNCTAELNFNQTVQQYNIYFEVIDSSDSEQTNENYVLVCALESEVVS